MKKYVKPNMRVIEVGTQNMIAASTLGITYEVADPNEPIN